jgi:hypothetical protein
MAFPRRKGAVQGQGDDTAQESNRYRATDIYKTRPKSPNCQGKLWVYGSSLIMHTGPSPRYCLILGSIDLGSILIDFVEFCWRAPAKRSSRAPREHAKAYAKGHGARYFCWPAQPIWARQRPSSDRKNRLMIARAITVRDFFFHPRALDTRRIDEINEDRP